MLKHTPILSTLVAFAVAVASLAPVAATRAEAAAQPRALEVAGRIDLPGYQGDFDHLEVDLKGNRLFLAAEGRGTLEVFDLRNGKHLRTVDGLGAPHGLLYLPDADKLIVTQTGSDGSTKVVDGATYQIVDSFKHTKGGDAMGYDAVRRRLYVVTGGRDMQQSSSWLVEIDPYTGRNYGELKFAADKVDALVIEQGGNKLYANVAGKNEMAVVDKKTRSIIATWPIKEGEKNASLAFDEATRRLFLVARSPGRLLVLNADTGETIANFKAPELCDQVLFDKVNRRIYALGGEGYIGVFAEKDLDHYEELARVPSAPGAKTGILVPELQKLYVAASSGSTSAPAAVLSFNILK